MSDKITARVAQGTGMHACRVVKKNIKIKSKWKRQKLYKIVIKIDASIYTLRNKSYDISNTRKS